MSRTIQQDAHYTLHMPAHLLTGLRGEEAATQYLRGLGYDIRERNVRCRRDVMDIVAYDRKHRMMVFAEVKTRSTVTANYPIHTAVDRRKRKCLLRAARFWCLKHQYYGSGRIDVVCMSEGNVIEHLMDLGSDFL